jgi:glycosyltransferase involved in cell wall biosynthesis
MNESQAEHPFVSVIIPTYNRRELVQGAVDSVLDQTYGDYEIIVVDDGSQDGTGEIIAACYGDRVRYVYQENAGESAARNRGIALARGTLVALLDSDDIWLRDKLARQVPLLERSPQAGVVFCQALLVDALDRSLDVPPAGHDLVPDDLKLESLLFRNTITASTALIRRSALREVGGFDQTVRFGEDWELWLRLRERWDFAFLPEPLVRVRVHKDTQCRFPNPSTIDRKLDDRVRFLSEAFSRVRGSLDNARELQRRSLARQYGVAAFASYACGRSRQGCRYLERAVGYDPDSWRDENRLSGMLLAHGIAAAETGGRFEPDQLTVYFERTLRNWPPGLRLSDDTKRRVWGGLYAEASYRSHLAGDDRATREFTLKAFRADPSLLGDRGMVKRLIRSLVRLPRVLTQDWRLTALVGKRKRSR